jgi:hypothetical protein
MLREISSVTIKSPVTGVNEDDRDSAIEQILRSAECYPAPVMEAKGLTPILNVSDIASTVAWFEKWGWKKLWDWGTPPTFGAVGSGKETCIFLCQGAQGGRGRGTNTTTFQKDGDEEGDNGSELIGDLSAESCLDIGPPDVLPRAGCLPLQRRQF